MALLVAGMTPAMLSWPSKQIHGLTHGPKNIEIVELIVIPANVVK